MSRAATNVSIVTTDGASGRYGLTVSSLSSVSADGAKPTLLVCVHQHSPAAAAILGNGAFCVNLLGEGAEALSDRFAGRVAAPDGDRFSGVDWEIGATFCPRLTGVRAAFDCRLVTSQLVGSHHVMFGSVEAVTIGATGGSPLVYAERAYRRLLPAA